MRKHCPPLSVTPGELFENDLPQQGLVDLLRRGGAGQARQEAHVLGLLEGGQVGAHMPDDVFGRQGQVTAIVFNNAVFGETGGHMTAATVLGQHTKTTLGGRDADRHGHPIRIAELVAQLDGTAYVARAGVHRASAIKLTEQYLRDASAFAGGLLAVTLLSC